MNLSFKLLDYTLSSIGDELQISEPLGWDGIYLRNKRHNDWHGFIPFMDDTYSSLEFTGSGKNLLLQAFELKGIEAHVELLISLNCDSNTAEDTIYIGRADFGKLSHNISSLCSISVGFLSILCIMQFKNRLDQPVNLESNFAFENSTILGNYIKLPYKTQIPQKNVVLVSKSSIKTTWRANYVIPIPLLSGTLNDNNTLMPLMQVELDDLKDFSGGSGSCLSGVTNSINDFEDIFTMNPLVRTRDFSINGDLHFKGTVRNNSGNSKETKLTMYAFRASKYLDVTQMIFNRGGLAGIPLGGGVSEGRTYCMTKSANLSILPNTGTTVLDTNPVSDTMPFEFYLDWGGIEFRTGEKLFVFFDWYLHNPYGTDADISIHFDDTSYIKLWQDSAFEPTPAKVYFVNEALSRITEAITDGAMRAHSEYFGRTDAEPYASLQDGPAGGHAITNGLKIRRYHHSDGTEALMTISMKELFDGLNAMHNIGMGIEPDPHRGDGYQLMRVEPMAYFYRDTVIMTCDHIAELTIESVPDRYYSTVQGGYVNWGAPTYNGLDDPFSRRSYRTTQDQQKTAYDKPLCNMIASPYAIEMTRREYGLSNSDWKWDNHIFVLDHSRDADGQMVIAPAGAAQSNLVSPIAYNALITPLRNLMRHIKTIFQTYRDAATGVLRFTGAEGNHRAAITSTSAADPALGLLTEDSDISYAVMQHPEGHLPLWRPEIVKFSYPLTYRQWKEIQSNPYGLIAYSVHDEPLQYGWLEDLKYSPYKGMADFVLRRKL